MDWVKAVAIAGSSAYGVEKILRAFKVWKAMYGNASTKGVTVYNGEYSRLLKTLGRIEGRIDHVVQRVDAIEQRLST